MGRQKKVAQNYRDMILTPQEAHEFLGVSRRTFFRLVETGIIPKDAEGEYRLGEIAEAYYKHHFGGESLTAAKTRLTRAQAELAELELAEERGELHRADAVMTVWADNVQNAKAKLLSIPTKIAPMSVGQDANVIQKLMKDQINEVLHELADYDERRIQRAEAARAK